MATLTRGELAKRTRVNLETVRYYEHRGLIPNPPRSASNYRLYPAEAVRRIRFIKRAQDLGFTLEEIKDLLSLQATSDARCADVLKRAQAKIADIEQKVRSLRAMGKALTRLTAECTGRGPITKCPILESLDSEEKR